MNLEYIESFIAVAKFQSLNFASEQLNISTPALSKRINHIENYFNCKLFERTRKGVFLTSKGEVVLEKLTKIQLELTELKNYTASQGSSVLRLGVLPSFAIRYQQLLENNEITKHLTVLVESNTQSLKEKLHDGFIDAFIGDISFLTEEPLFHKSLYQEKYVVMYSDKKQLTGSPSITIEALQSENLLLLNPPCDTATFIQNQLPHQHKNINFKNDFESLIASVKNSKNITVFPESLKMRTTHMNLFYKTLSNYARNIGIASYNQDPVEKLTKILNI